MYSCVLFEHTEIALQCTEDVHIELDILLRRSSRIRNRSMGIDDLILQPISVGWLVIKAHICILIILNTMNRSNRLNVHPPLKIWFNLKQRTRHCRWNRELINKRMNQSQFSIAWPFKLYFDIDVLYYETLDVSWRYRIYLTWSWNSQRNSKWRERNVNWHCISVSE